MSIKIKFLGGASSIGASCALLEVGEKSYVIDCGIRFKKEAPLPNMDDLYGKNISAILVTHAHTDHTGALPIAHAAFPGASIYMTVPTYDLVRILFADSLKIMNSDEKEAEIPLYNKGQIEDTLCSVHPVNYFEKIKIDEIEVTWLPASHILGAAMIFIETEYGNILFTGDYSVQEQYTVPGLEFIKLHVDILVTESTYGDRLHSNRQATESSLLHNLSDVLEKKGKVLIPAFALGRAQELILMFKKAIREKRMPETKIYVDGLVTAMCYAYASNDKFVSKMLFNELRNGDGFFNKTVTAVKNKSDRTHIINSDPCIIIASSGMLTGGASAFYASQLVKNNNNAIFLSGYQDEESPGRRLLNLVNNTSGNRELFLNNSVHSVLCQFSSYSLSAHADSFQIKGFIEKLNPKTVILVHGDTVAKEKLRDSLSVKDVVIGNEASYIERTYKKIYQKNYELGASFCESNELEGFINNRKIENIPEYKFTEKQNSHFCTIQIDLNGTTFKVDSVNKNKLISKNLSEKKLIKCILDSKILDFQEKIEESGGAIYISKDREDELVSLNYKSRLFEYCAVNSLKKPIFEYKKLDACNVFIGTGKIILDGNEIESKFYRSTKRKIIEQAISEEFMNMYEIKNDTNILEFRNITEEAREALIISMEKEVELISANHKGNLFEYCASKFLKNPTFECTQVDKFNSFVGRGKIIIEENEIESKLYKSTKVRVIEHAICEEFLRMNVVKNSSGQLKNEVIKADDSARGTINELKQKNIIKDFGYVLIEKSGPSHLPIFEMEGFAILMNGQKIMTERKKSPTKKLAEAEVASELMSILFERNIRDRSKETSQEDKFPKRNYVEIRRLSNCRVMRIDVLAL